MTTPSFVDYDRIPGTAWRMLEEAADQRAHPMRLVVLASVDDADRPDARLLVLRGASRDKQRLWFHTDCRSKKIDELRHQPRVCIVGYDPRDDIQLRVFGVAKLHHGDDIADRHWQQTNIAIRTVFGSSHAPGEPLPEHDPRTHRHQALMDSEDAEAGRYNFLVIAVDVELIDWIQVDGARQRRAVIRRDNDWTVEPLAP